MSDVWKRWVCCTVGTVAPSDSSAPLITQEIWRPTVPLSPSLISLSHTQPINPQTELQRRWWLMGMWWFWFSEVSDSNNLWLKAVDSESIAIVFWLYSGLSEEKAPMGATFACLGMKDRWCWKEIFDKTVMWYDATCWTALQAKALDLYFNNVCVFHDRKYLEYRNLN